MKLRRGVIRVGPRGVGIDLLGGAVDRCPGVPGCRQEYRAVHLQDQNVHRLRRAVVAQVAVGEIRLRGIAGVIHMREEVGGWAPLAVIPVDHRGGVGRLRRTGSHTDERSPRQHCEGQERADQQDRDWLLGHVALSLPAIRRACGCRGIRYLVRCHQDTNAARRGGVVVSRRSAHCCTGATVP